MPEITAPRDIEKRSFAIISELLGDRILDPENEMIIKRVIHTTADLEFADTLTFSEHAVSKGIEALRAGCQFMFREYKMHRVEAFILPEKDLPCSSFALYL